MDKRTRDRFKKIEDSVQGAGGVAIVSMEELRDAGGYKKLGAVIVESLAAKLDEAGLGSLPAGVPLPTSQKSTVRIYKQGSPIGLLVEAVTNPSGSGDEALRRLSASDANGVLEQIRELVCGSPPEM